MVACGVCFLTPGLQHQEHGISHWTARQSLSVILFYFVFVFCRNCFKEIGT